MHGIADTEPEVYIDRAIRSYCAHATADLHLGVGWKFRIFFDEALEIDSVTVETNLSPWKLRQSCALSLLRASRIDPESDLRIEVDDTWTYEVKNGRESSGVIHVAIRPGRNDFTLHGFDLLSGLVIVHERHLILEPFQTVKLLI